MIQRDRYRFFQGSRSCGGSASQKGNALMTFILKVHGTYDKLMQKEMEDFPKFRTGLRQVFEVLNVAGDTKHALKKRLHIGEHIQFIQRLKNNG